MLSKALDELAEISVIAITSSSLWFRFNPIFLGYIGGITLSTNHLIQHLILEVVKIFQTLPQQVWSRVTNMCFINTCDFIFCPHVLCKQLPIFQHQMFSLFFRKNRNVLLNVLQMAALYLSTFMIIVSNE